MGHFDDCSAEKLGVGSEVRTAGVPVRPTTQNPFKSCKWCSGTLFIDAGGATGAGASDGARHFNSVHSTSGYCIVAQPGLTFGSTSWCHASNSARVGIFEAAGPCGFGVNRLPPPQAANKHTNRAVPPNLRFITLFMFSIALFSKRAHSSQCSTSSHYC